MAPLARKRREIALLHFVDSLARPAYLAVNQSITGLTASFPEAQYQADVFASSLYVDAEQRDLSTRDPRLHADVEPTPKSPKHASVDPVTGSIGINGNS
jgi:hypothetical protein